MRKVKLSLVLLTIIFTNLMYAQQGVTRKEKALIIEKYKKGSKNHQFSKLELNVIYDYLKSQDTKKVDEACTKLNKRNFKKESKSQKEKRNTTLNARQNKAPISLPDNAIFPGEFEEIQGVFVNYPYSWWDEHGSLILTEHADGAPSYSKFFRELINAIQQAGVKVYINVRSQADTDLLIRHFQDKGTPLSNYEFLINPTDSFWTRDFGPINFYYGADDKIGWVDLDYGGRRNDDDLTPLWAEKLGIAHTYMPLVFEGGNIIMNGYQSLTTSDRVYLNNNEHSKAHVDATLKAAFNLENLNMLKALTYDGGTGHVDLYIDMINENRYVYTEQPSEMANIPDYTDYQKIIDNVDYLSTLTSPGGTGKPYLFGTVPFPTKDDGTQYDDAWDIYNSSRTFSNHLIVNKTIIQPVFNNGQTGDIASDNAALDIIRKEYPGYTIIPIDSRALIGTGGSIHCVTKEFHAENPVRFKHYPYYGQIENCQTSYPVDVVISNKSGINNATLFSRAKGSSSWKQTNMTKGDNNHWTADITLSSGTNQVTEYYISATSNNNKTMTYPMTADQGGAFTFWCSSQTDTEAPSAPINLTTSNITQTSLDLSWTASTDNVAVTGYEIYQGTTLIGSTAAITSFPVSNLTANTSYSFYVKAKDAAGNVSTSSNVVNVTTKADNTNPNDCSNIPDYQGNVSYTNGDRVVYQNKVYEMINNQWVFQFDCTASPVDTEAPTAPSNLMSENITEISVDLYWTASTDNTAVVAYDIYQDNSLIGSTTSPTTSFNVSNLTENTSYSFFIQARDEAGNASSSSNTISVKTLSTITNPNDCSVIPDYQSGVTYNNGDRVVYSNKVYEMTNGQWIYLFDCNATSDTQAPTAPNNLNAYNITETTLELSWDASNDNVAVTAYIIYQGNTMIGESSPGTYTTFNVNNLTENTSYSFTVYAKDAAGNVSTASNTITATTLSTTTDPNDCSNIPDYQSGKTYYNGDRVVYYGQVYEMIYGQWTYMFDCTSSYRVATSETKSTTTIYPNPVESTFSVASDQPIKGASYVIFDGNGRKLKSGKYQSDINVQELNLISGTTYYVKFYLNNEVIEKKFIKK